VVCKIVPTFFFEVETEHILRNEKNDVISPFACVGRTNARPSRRDVATVTATAFHAL